MAVGRGGHPARDTDLAGGCLLTPSVRSVHDIGDALPAGPQIRFPPGAPAVIDPRVTPRLVPSETELVDDAGRIVLPSWIGLRREIPRTAAAARVRAPVDALGGCPNTAVDGRCRA